MIQVVYASIAVMATIRTAIIVDAVFSQGGCVPDTHYPLLAGMPLSSPIGALASLSNQEAAMSQTVVAWL